MAGKPCASMAVANLIVELLHVSDVTTVGVYLGGGGTGGGGSDPGGAVGGSRRLRSRSHNPSSVRTAPMTAAGVRPLQKSKIEPETTNTNPTARMTLASPRLRTPSVLPAVLLAAGNGGHDPDRPTISVAFPWEQSTVRKDSADVRAQLSVRTHASGAPNRR